MIAKCLSAAKAIVDSYKIIYPDCEDVINGQAGASASRFVRSGKSTTTGEANLAPSWLSTLIQDSSQLANRPTQAMLTRQDQTLSNVMDRSNTSLPSYAVPQTFAGLDPTAYSGAAGLSTIIGRNPFSSAYETATAGAFQQRAADALAQAATGQDAVRGGDARTGIAQGVLSTRLAQERGSEVRNAQLQDAGLQQQAAGLAGTLESNRRGQALSAQEQAARQFMGIDQNRLGAAGLVDQQQSNNLRSLTALANILSARQSTQEDDLVGRGYQAGGQMGLNCCFNFVAATDGDLPSWFEQAKVDHYTPARRRGYTRMGVWLVPKMLTRPWVKNLVKYLVVKPFVAYGRFLYENRTLGRVFAPYCQLWLRVWGFFGR